MKLLKSTIAVLAIASSSLFAVPGYAESHPNCKANPVGEWRIDPAAYVVRNCAFCHGDPTLQGRFVAPRLAGQHQQYIAIQLDRLRNKTRDNPFAHIFMSPAATQIQPENECELGAFISTLPPESANDGNQELRAIGEEIFARGVPSDGVPACQFCHGPEAQGIGRFPRIGGLSYHYVKRRLVQWAEGYNATSEKMPAIASKLSPDQIEAVASYLSFVTAAPSKGEF